MQKLVLFGNSTAGKEPGVLPWSLCWPHSLAEEGAGLLPSALHQVWGSRSFLLPCLQNNLPLMTGHSCPIPARRAGQPWVQNQCPAAPGAVTALLQHLPGAATPQCQRNGIASGSPSLPGGAGKAKWVCRGRGGGREGKREGERKMRRKRRRRAAPSSPLQWDLRPSLLDAVAGAPAKKPDLNVIMLLHSG